MIIEKDVYIAYRQAKSLQSGKGFRVPKDWDEWYSTKLSAKNREFLELATGYFNTTWSNVNLQQYMECGCALYKTFSYHMFLKPNILQHYIEKDKQRKRKIKADTLAINASFDYINECLSEKVVVGYNFVEEYTNLEVYCKIRAGDKKAIVEDYLKGLVDAITLTYCIYYKYIVLSDIEREYCYNVTNRYRDFLQQMFQVEKHIKEKDI